VGRGGAGRGGGVGRGREQGAGKEETKETYAWEEGEQGESEARG